MCGGQDVHQTVLGVVGVLILVHVNVPETMLVALPDLGEDFEEGDGLHDEVVEVHGVVLVETFLVEIVDLGDVLGHEALGLAQVVVRIQKEVLGGGDLGVERPRVEALGVLAELDDATLYEPDLIR